ncbi:transposase [Streptoverticillium reticulum]|uniref:transposase n=1 Tax=Streptoverticillium reticulum TaxID=1433415 RepID=UPI0039BF8619
MAGLNVHTGQVLTERIDRNNADTFIGFLRRLNESIPAGTSIHPVMDNGSSHVAKKTKAWPATRPRFNIHHTPEHASRLNQVELFFSALTRRLLRRGQFAYRDELAAAIDTFVLACDEHDAKPYRWTYDGSPLKAAWTPEGSTRRCTRAGRLLPDCSARGRPAADGGSPSASGRRTPSRTHA